MGVKLGQAKYGGTKKTYFKLKDGKVVFRILPPMKNLADEGVWSKYYRVHYGYTNSAGKSRPFESSLVMNRKTKMVEIPDAANERLEKLKARLDEAKKAGNKKVVEELHKLVGAPKSRYNLDNNHYMNVIDTQGNIGILKLRHKAKQALDLVIRELRDKGIDPLSVDNGRFFTFTRSGMGNETQFSVSVYTKTITVEGVGEVEQAVIHKLTPDIIQRLDAEAAELEKLFRAPTADQIDQIVAESNLATGVSPNIDDILGYNSSESAGDGGDEGGEEEESTTTPDATVTTTVVQAAAPAQEAKPAAIVETKADVKATETKQTKTTPNLQSQTTAEKVAEMSDDEFLKSLGIS